MGDAAPVSRARSRSGGLFEGDGHPARAIIATFRERERNVLHERLSGFGVESWDGDYNWLEKSGLELYFLDRLKALGIEDAVPVGLLARMERNFADNKVRTIGLFEEFVRINQTFGRAQLNYCNVLGVSQVPISCRDPALRRQLSLDFLVADDGRESCETLLAKLGYAALAGGEHFREYRPQTAESETDSGIYAVIANRSVGVYFLSSATEGVERAPYDMLMRRRTKMWNGFGFPALTECDQFVAQAMRMWGHIGIEWTRLAFLWEFSNCVRFWRHDEAFWSEVIERAREHPLRPIAIGTAMRLATEIFWGSIPPAILEWATHKVDAPLLQWSEVYGWDSLAADFPDTTLLEILAPRDP